MSSSNSFGDAKKTSSELLEAQAHIWNHIFNFINSMSLKCAVELGIPDIIHSHGKPITISELSNALSINPEKSHCIPRLMRILVHSGIFALANTNENDDNEEEEKYVLTNSSRLLLKDNPVSITPFVLAMLDPIMTNPWHFTSSWFFNDAPTPFDNAHGMGLWSYAGSDCKLNNLFNQAMESDARLVSSVLMDKGKEVFDGLGSVVDVGGGTGTVARAIVEAFPNIECTVLELPHVVAGLKDTDNIKYVPGDMFEEIPPADAVLLKIVLHNWNDDECLKILRNSRKAIEGRKGGKVIIIDMVRGKENNETQLKFDMLMMALLTGKERNETEWAKLFNDVGFSGYKIIPILGARSVIEVYP